jgi:hypothetical protein
VTRGRPGPGSPPRAVRARSRRRSGRKERHDDGGPPERARGDQPGALAQQARDRVDACDLQGLVRGQRGQHAGQTLGEHGLARSGRPTISNLCPLLLRAAFVGRQGMALQILRWVLTVQPSHRLGRPVYQRSTSGVLTPSSAPYLPPAVTIQGAATSLRRSLRSDGRWRPPHLLATPGLRPAPRSATRRPTAPTGRQRMAVR